jgi:CheY-like chemotaxis protein
MKQLQDRQVKVLIIDDNRLIIEVIAAALKQHGHTYELLVGVKDFAGSVLNGVTHDGNFNPINLPEHHFDVAFIDGSLPDYSMTGPEIVSCLIKSGIPCIGISADLGENDALAKAGCFQTVLKGLFDLVLVDLWQVIEDGKAKADKDGA